MAGTGRTVVAAGGTLNITGSVYLHRVLENDGIVNLVNGGSGIFFTDGTLNNNEDRDRGWTVELQLPWQGLRTVAVGDGRALPPHDGDIWRMDFSRFNTYKEAAPAQDSGGWTWSSHRVWDSHVPECFPYIHFSTQPVQSQY